jgi:hypothetical protein
MGLRMGQMIDRLPGSTLISDFLFSQRVLLCTFSISGSLFQNSSPVNYEATQIGTMPYR